MPTTTVRILALSLCAVTPSFPAVAAAADPDDAVGTVPLAPHARLEPIGVTAGPGRQATVALDLDGRPVVLELSPRSVRADDFVLRVQRPDGGLEAVPAPPVRTFAGRVAGAVRGRVTASMKGGELTSTLSLDDGTTWHVQPVVAGDGARLHGIYRHAEIGDAPGVCAAGELGGPPVPRMAASGGPAGAGGDGNGAPAVALLAIDADHEFFLLNGSSVEETVADIEAVINGVADIYLAELGIEYRIAEIVVRAQPDDPYEATDAAELLFELRDEWNAAHGDVARDAVHLMTGRNLDGSTIGIAWLGVMCHPAGFAYGLSQSRYTSNFGRRVSLTAHELAHNWGATHCAPSCGSSAPDDCAIMCPCNGGCSGDTSTFGAAATAQMLDFAAAASCLGASVGACCLDDGTCVDVLTADECAALGGAFLGTGAACADVECAADCAADLNGDGVVGVEDLLAVIMAWGGGGGVADVTGDGAVDADDLVDILLGWGTCG